MSTTTTLFYLEPALPQFRRFHIEPARGRKTLAEKRKNYSFSAHTVRIEDIRGAERNYTLDGNGFRVTRHPLSPTDLRWLRSHDEDFVARHHYAQLEQHLKRCTGAAEVVVFGHEFHWNRPAPSVKVAGESDEGPVELWESAHLDYSETSAAKLAESLRPDNPAVRRAQIVSTWRPFEEETDDEPGQLVMLDYPSLWPSVDMIPVKAIHSNRNEENECYILLHSPKHQWKYLSRQRADEVAIIKVYDSKHGAGVSPYSAFHQGALSIDGRRMEGIEIRAALYYT